MTGVAIAALVFLSLIKTAYESLSEVALRVMMSEREGSRRARFFRELLDNRQEFELILILGTQLSVAISSILLTYIIITLGITYPLFMAFLAVFAVILIFRQFVPRLIVQNRPETMLWLLLPLFQLFYSIFSIFAAPINALLEKLKSKEKEEESFDEDEQDDTLHEFEALIEVAEEEGIIEEQEGELIQSVIEFGETIVSEIMRPRPLIVAVPITATVEDARQVIIEKKYSRIPVYEETIDDIKGLVYVRDLLAYIEPDKLHTSVREVMREVYQVPETKPIADLLEDMQRSKAQMAIVIDEYGGVAGLLTVEDIIEEVMGEIEDEDRGLLDRPPEQLPDGSYELEGSTEIGAVENLFDKELAADDFSTIAGLLIRELDNRVPEAGEKIEFRGLEFQVLVADSQRINKIRVRPLTKPENGSAAESA